MSSAGNGIELSRGVGIDVVRLTEGAATAAASELGRGDEQRIFSAAIAGFRQALDEVSLAPRIVMGEDGPGVPGWGDGHVVNGPGHIHADAAFKVVECLTACALGGRNAMSAIVLAPPGSIRAVPRLYMDKIAVGPAAREAIEMGLDPASLFARVAEARSLRLEDLSVVILDRPRNRRWLDSAREAGVKVRLIADGDLAAAIATAVPDSGIDLLVGSGGSREGWLAAAALRGLGGEFIGRFLPSSSDDERALLQAGFEDPRGVFRAEEILPEEFIFSATGITEGDALRGVRHKAGVAVSESLMVRTASDTVRWIRTERRVSAP